MTSSNASSNKRIARNTTFLYVRMFFALIVSLYTSRVVLNTLGVSDYGVWSVVAGFVSLFGFFNAILSSSVQRYYNYEGGRSGEDGFRRVYITGLLIHLALAVIILIALETFGLWYVNNVLVVPEGRLPAANILFQSSALSMLLVVIQTPYTGAIMAKERMDFYAIVSIADVVLRLLIVLALPFFPYDKLIVYALLQLLISVFNFVAYSIYSKRQFHELKFKFVYYPELFRSMMTFAGWNLIGTIAYMFKGQGVNMLLNFYFGTVINAARGVATQISHAVAGFTSNISTAFRPQIVESFARGEENRTKRMMFTESKVCYLLIYTLIVPIILEINYILKIWLGEAVPDLTNIFTVLVLLEMLVGTLNTPLTQVVQATGNLKLYQIVSSCIYILIIPASWLVLHLGYNATSVFVVAFVMAILNQIGCLLAANKVFQFGYMDYFKEVLVPCFVFTLLLPIIPFVIHNILPTNFVRLLFVVLADGVVAIIVGYYLVLQKREREIVLSFIKRKK